MLRFPLVVAHGGGVYFASATQPLLDATFSVPPVSFLVSCALLEEDQTLPGTSSATVHQRNMYRLFKEWV